MRVGLRQLRSALSAFGKFTPGDRLAWLRPGPREAIGALGSARDWDMFQSDPLVPLLAARPDDPDLEVLRIRVKARGQSGYRTARKILESADYIRFVLSFGHWFHARGGAQQAMHIRPSGWRSRSPTLLDLFSRNVTSRC